MLTQQAQGLLAGWACFQDNRVDGIINDKFYDELLDVASKLGEKEISMVPADLNADVGRSANVYDGVHGGIGYGCRNPGDMVLEFGHTTEMIV